MGSDSGGREYSLTEIFAIKFVLADILIIAALLLAGPVWAFGFTVLMVVSVVLVWYLTTQTDNAAETTSVTPDQSHRDPVTELQERYAAGELSDDEFERKLDRLVDANERATAAGIETDDLALDRHE